jgi:hypothetical protein
MATKKKKAQKPSKAAREAAATLLAPADLMRAAVRQLELQAQQLDQMDQTLKALYVRVTGQPFPNTPLLTEPAPVPGNGLLTEAPTS